jgi:formate hydrogenlyase subunit 3/multisubunit Na+/H+ antiporter MnhD subunit
MASSTTELTIDKIGGIFILVLITLFLATFLASIEFISKARQSSDNNKVS